VLEKEGRSGMGAVGTRYSYQNILCGVFMAHANEQARKRSQALLKVLGKDGKLSEVDCECLCSCKVADMRHFLLTYFVSIFCDVTGRN
jgi:hypothetical protein